MPVKTSSFKCGFNAHVRSVAIRMVFCFFIALFLSLFFFDGFYFFGEMIFIAFIGLVIFEFLNSTEIIVTDGRLVVSKRGRETHAYDYKTYYISLSNDKRSLIVEHRQNGTKETLKCPYFDEGMLAEIAETVKIAQKSWYLARSAANQTSKNLYAAAKTASETAKSVTMTAAEASKRNPYSKNYVPPTGKAQSPQAASSAVSTSAKSVTLTAAEASNRNPYSKNYVPPTGKAQSPQAASYAASTSAKPTFSATSAVSGQSNQPSGSQISTNQTFSNASAAKEHSSTVSPIMSAVKSDDSQKASKASEITAAKLLGGDIPSNYNKIPELPKISDEDYKRLPDIVPPSFSQNKADSAPAKTFTHDHGEDFHKIVFYYPRRNITERTERTNALFVLYTLAASVLVFLMTYILTYSVPEIMIENTNFIMIATAGILVAASVALIAARLVYSRMILSGLFSKLEITDENLVIDNIRYKFSEMSEMYITPNRLDSGRRMLSFKTGGKTVLKGLGPSNKPAKKRTDEYFTRYAELVSELKKRGFKS